jgi:hypothetical protein
MNDDQPRNIQVSNAQAVFTDLSLYQQVYITDLLLGPAAAVQLARRQQVDLARYDWWRIQLTADDKQQLERQARALQVQRGREDTAAYHDRQTHRAFFDGITWRKARGGPGRVK